MYKKILMEPTLSFNKAFASNLETTNKDIAVLKQSQSSHLRVMDSNYSKRSTSFSNQT